MSNKVKVEGIMQLEQAVAYVEDLLANLKSGSVCITSGEDCVRLQPATLIELEMTASQKKDKEKFTLKMTWQPATGGMVAPPAEAADAS